MEQQSFQHTTPARIPTVATPGAPAHTTIHHDINTATRRQHTTLNRLIIDRIPLGLPPAVADPAKYGQGIATFAQIYFAFEQIWDEIIEANARQDPNDQSHEARLLSWLATLRPPGLVRSRRLELDLQHLSRRTNTDLRQNSGAYEHILRRTRESLRRRPHTLVAYAWTMYMALFSGGRWIRQVLRKAGPLFWHDDMRYDEHHDPSPDPPGFSFLFFDDGKDGLAIQEEFKSRLAEAEDLLNEKERRDIVDASTVLFDDCIASVHILDDQTQGLTSRRKGMLRVVAFATGLIGLAMGISGTLIYFEWMGIDSKSPWFSWRLPVIDDVVRHAWARVSQCKEMFR